MSPIIAVTGATGSTGSQVVAQLLAKDQRVRAVVRTLDDRADRLHTLGATVVAADLFDRDQMAQALRGAGRAYFCPPTHPRMIESAQIFASAAQEAGLESVVVLSQWLANAHSPSRLTRHHFQADAMFAALPNTATTIVNPGFFADNYLQTIDFAAQLGLMPNPIGNSRNAPPSNPDIAAVVVGALLDPDRHAGHSYRPTGPELLDAHDMARIVGSVLGRTVRPMPMPAFMFAKAMRVSGYDEFMTAQTRTYVAEHRRGTFAHGAPTDDVEVVSGRPAETFEATARGYAELPGAHRSARQLAKVLSNLARITVTPAGNPHRFPQDPGEPADTHLSIDDPGWLTSHHPDLLST